jgi:hypothetical protein
MTPLRLVLAGAAGSAAADFGDQVDLALGFQRNEVGVLEDFAVDRHRHAFLDLAAEAGYRRSSSSTMRGKLFAGDPRQDQAGAGREPLRQAALADGKMQIAQAGLAGGGRRIRTVRPP